jgi:hypothetical protein
MNYGNSLRITNNGGSNPLRRLVTEPGITLSLYFTKYRLFSEIQREELGKNCLPWNSLCNRYEQMLINWHLTKLGNNQFGNQPSCVVLSRNIKTGKRIQFIWLWNLVCHTNWKYGLRDFGNRVLKEIFWDKGDKVIEIRIKLRVYKLRNLCFQYILPGI